MKFNRTILEFTQPEKPSGRISFYASLVGAEDEAPAHARVFSLAFSAKDKSLYLFPFSDSDSRIRGVGDGVEFSESVEPGHRHISFHESGVVNVTLGRHKQYRLRGPKEGLHGKDLLFSFAVQRKVVRPVAAEELGRKGKPIFIGGVGAGLAACVAVFARSGTESTEKPPLFTLPQPPIMQVVDVAMRVRDRDLTYWFSTWSAHPLFEEDWLVSGGLLPDGMMQLPTAETSTQRASAPTGGG